MSKIGKQAVLSVYLACNANARDVVLAWLRTTGKAIGLPLLEVRAMLEGDAPYHGVFAAKHGLVAVQVVGAEDIPPLVASTPNSLAPMYLDLLVDYLYGQGGCPQVFDSSGIPRDPRTLLPRRVAPGKHFKFALGHVDLDVEPLPFKRTELPRLAVLERSSGGVRWRDADALGRAPRVLCELRYKHIAHALLENTLPEYELITVTRKVEGYVLAGRADFAIDVVLEGKTARRNGLRPALTIMKCYPIALKNQVGIS